MNRVGAMVAIGVCILPWSALAGQKGVTKTSQSFNSVMNECDKITYKRVLEAFGVLQRNMGSCELNDSRDGDRIHFQCQGLPGKAAMFTSTLDDCRAFQQLNRAFGGD